MKSDSKVSSAVSSTKSRSVEKWKFLYLLALSVGLVSLLLNIQTWNQNHAIQLWNGIGMRMQMIWDNVLDRIGDNSFHLYVYVMNTWTLFLYWTFGLAYLLMELNAWPKWMFRRKVQPNIIVDKKRLYSLFRVNLFNQFFVMIPLSIFGHFFLEYKSNSPPVRELPTFHRLVIDFFILVPIQEIGVYYTHRMFHHRLLYKWTHKWHHEWTAPIALTSMYNHPLDQLIGNFLPVTVGLSFTNSHFFTQWLWFSWSILRGLNDHSGYRLFSFPSPVRHDFHHQTSTECFAVWAWGPLDYLHGTDKHFRAKMAAIAAQ